MATIIRESCKSAHRKSATQDQMIELKSTLQQDESKDEVFLSFATKSLMYETVLKNNGIKN